MEDIFTWLGETLGHLIRFIVDGLTAMFSGIDDAGAGFVNGLSSSLGITPTFFSIALLILGVFLIWRAIRAAMNRAIVAALVWALLGLIVLSTLLP